MTSRNVTAATLATAMIVVFIAAPASALRMDKHNANHGCEQLVTASHPDLKGHDRGSEIKKCKGDPDSYSKSNPL